MGDAAEYFYYPFPADWWHPRRWKREILRSPREAPVALAGYRKILTDEVIFGQNWMHHPLVSEHLFIGNRWRMLETGAVLARLRTVADYKERLLSAQAYTHACAELRAALLLNRLGFRVHRDPANTSTSPKKRKTGPDWLAQHSAGQFGVEVKCVLESDLMRARSLFASQVCHATMTVLGGERSVELTLNPRAVAESVVGRWANLRRADEMTLELLAEAEATGAATTALGSVALTGPGCGSMIGPTRTDEEHEARRIRDTLQEGADQLRDWAPGIVVLDTSVDRSVMRRCCQVAQLMSETWAQHLAAVILVADTYPGFAMTIVKGPRFEAFASADIRGPRACAKGHLHVDTFGGPGVDCTLDARFDDYPAFCIRGLGHEWLQRVRR